MGDRRRPWYPQHGVGAAPGGGAPNAGGVDGDEHHLVRGGERDSGVGYTSCWLTVMWRPPWRYLRCR